MTKVIFLDSSTIEVVLPNGESFLLTSHLPVHYTRQKPLAQSMAMSFNENFSDDKADMSYWVLMKMIATEGFSFSYYNEDRNVERERIGAKIRGIREEKAWMQKI